MDEAIHMIASRGVPLDMLRVRAFPFHQDVGDFIADHEFVFVVEQNRDSQLRTLVTTNATSTRCAWCRSCTSTAPRSRRVSSPIRSATTSMP